MIRRIEEGQGVKVSLWMNDKIENFSLVVLKQKNSWDSESIFTYAFINDDRTKYFKSSDTNGNTGFYCNAYDINSDFFDRYEIVTNDINEINKIAEAEEIKRKKEKLEEDNYLTEKVIRINNLPKRFNTGIPELEEILVFTRSEAIFNPLVNSKIRGANINLFKKDSHNSLIILNDYVTKDGKILTKEFTKYINWIIGNVNFEFNPKEVLIKLIERRKELVRMIQDIVGGKYDNQKIC
jgi:hypothetical protein